MPASQGKRPSRRSALQGSAQAETSSRDLLLAAARDAKGTEGERVLGRLLAFATEVASELGLDQGGYRIVTNTGSDGGQSVFHLHLHLLGGRRLTWPPG